ncbi:hypothetical protein VTO73DRAFT_14862 [Trametes versicolor]
MTYFAYALVPDCHASDDTGLQHHTRTIQLAFYVLLAITSLQMHIQSQQPSYPVPDTSRLPPDSYWSPLHSMRWLQILILDDCSDTSLLL